MKELFAHPKGDHLTMLNVYHAFKGEEAQANPKQWCHDHFLSYRALQQADNVRMQLKRIMERSELELMSTPFENKKYYENIQRALVAGFFMQVAKRDGNGKQYTTVKDEQTVLLHPSTVLAEDSEWVVYNEFVLTTKNYIRTVTSVRPEWLMVSLLWSRCFFIFANSGQDISPNYYDLSTFKKGDIKTALQRASTRLMRKEAEKRR
jgi:pre-mRNA-splicing factor ATP-dependent RNA helicase DHX15/PRP43